MADDTTSLVNDFGAKYGTTVPILSVNEDSVERESFGNYSNNGFIDGETENCSNPKTITDNLNFKTTIPFSTDKINKSDDGTNVNSVEPTNKKCTVTVEPIVFLSMLATSFQMITTANLMINRICTQNLNFSEAVCQNYTGNLTVEDLVQTKSTNYGMYKSLIETIPGVIFSLFVGSWSDRHGRRFPIISPLLGSLGNIITMIIISSHKNIPVEFLFIGSLLGGMSGGTVSLIMGVFSYISDITTPLTRMKRIMLVDLALFVPMPIGLLLSGIIYNNWGFVPVYGTSLGIQLLVILYTVFFLPETITPNPNNKRNIIKDMFDIQNVKANLKICCVKRKDSGRAYINLTLLSTVLFLLPLMGESTVMLLFVKRQLNWDQGQLSLYSAYSILISAVGLILIFRFVLKRWKVNDMYLVILAAVGVMLKNAITAFSYYDWMLYLGSSVTFFQMLAMPVLRTFISKLVQQEEQGKIFAVIASCEALVPVFTAVVYSQVYNLTKDTFAGAIFLMSAGVMTIPIAMSSWIYYDQAKRKKRLEHEPQSQISPAIA